MFCSRRRFGCEGGGDHLLPLVAIGRGKHGLTFVGHLQHDPHVRLYVKCVKEESVIGEDQRVTPVEKDDTRGRGMRKKRAECK